MILFKRNVCSSTEGAILWDESVKQQAHPGTSKRAPMLINYNIILRHECKQRNAR